jgi:hypothetical protein
MKPLHIGITSVLFDYKPEGICTGRLVRALLDRGHRVTLLTSTKERSDFTHANLRKIVVSHRPRSPRWLYKTLARLQGKIYSNFYWWSQTLSRTDFQGDTPDFFYGRAWPHASLVPAYELATRYRRPLVLHFSDPFPAPTVKLDGDPGFFTNLQKMVDAADCLSFTNVETIAYQKKFLRFEPDQAFVLNHVAPAPRSFGAAGTPGHFYHVGTVGPTRPAGPLLDGFALHVGKYPEHRLYFVGLSGKYLNAEIHSRGLEGKVHVLPFTRDPGAIFQQAGVLISIDALISEPVYTPTKVVDYLVADRPVLCLTPPGSPVSKLAARSQNTALAVTDYSPEAIAAGMENICACPWDKTAYAHRVEAMRDFSGEAVIEQFERMAERCGQSPHY